MNLPEIHITDKPIDAIDIIRQKSISGDEDDDPVYICNISDVIKKYSTWTESMPRVRPFFAIKANDDPHVIQVLATLGAGYDCASKGEIDKVMSYGVGPESIIYANPTKPISHLKFASHKNVDLMTVDNSLSFRKLLNIIRQQGKLVLRIRYEAKASFRPLGMKYGCDIDTEARDLIELSKSMGLNMVGISFHVGSGCMDALAFEQAIEASKKLFNFAETVGYHFNFLDIGGGFPGKNHTDIEEFASIINHSLDEHFPSPDITIISEPGRFFVTSAYTLACRVHSKREVREDGEFKKMMYYINDGIFGSFAAVLSRKIFHPDLIIVHPMTLKPANEKLYKSSVWGPTCDGIDEVCEDVSLPNLDFNDFIIFENMGAYTIVTASLFNGYPIPNVEYYVQRKDLGKIKQE